MGVSDPAAAGAAVASGLVHSFLETSLPFANVNIFACLQGSMHYP